jgi:hypothetical protein
MRDRVSLEDAMVNLAEILLSTGVLFLLYLTVTYPPAAVLAANLRRRALVL